MEDQHYIFYPGTNTSKCPMPTTFKHLLKFVTKVEQYIALHSQEEIININNQLDQTTNLIISNIIQRVIAQLIGQTDKGFATIKGTDDGALHVHQVNPLTGLDVNATLEAGDEIIGKVIISPAAPTLEIAKIDDVDGGNILTIAGTASKVTKITSIVLVVGGQTNITFTENDTPFTGSMDFGGTDEPRGIVIPHGSMPLTLGLANDFKIASSASVQCSGYVVYYKE